MSDLSAIKASRRAFLRGSVAVVASAVAPAPAYATGGFAPLGMSYVLVGERGNAFLPHDYHRRLINEAFRIPARLVEPAR